MPLWVSQGVAHHEKEKALFGRRKLERFGIEDPEIEFDSVVSSKLLGVHGIADMLLIGKNCTAVLEFKIDHRSLYRGAILQLAAYSIATEETYNTKVPRSYFVVGTRAKVVPIVINEELREKVRMLRFEMGQVFATGLMPNSSAGSAQCGQCEFIARCNDRD